MVKPGVSVSGVSVRDSRMAHVVDAGLGGIAQHVVRILDLLGEARFFAGPKNGAILELVQAAETPS